MDLDKHLIATGGAGRNIHIFLDHFYRYFREDHRVILHHQEGIKVVGKIFGYEAIPIAESHIRDDWYDTLPLNYNDTKFYRPIWAYDIRTFMEAYVFANEFLKYWIEVK